jgi:hypothetical protein
VSDIIDRLQARLEASNPRVAADRSAIAGSLEALVRHHPADAVQARALVDAWKRPAAGKPDIDPDDDPPVRENPRLNADERKRFDESWQAGAEMACARHGGAEGR